MVELSPQDIKSLSVYKDSTSSNTQGTENLSGHIVNLISPQGETISLDANNAKSALDQGYRFETETDKQVAQAVADSSAPKVFLKKAVNEYFFGIPEKISTEDTLERLKREAIEKEHPIASSLGSATGFVGNILTPGLGEVGGLTRLGKVAERTIVGAAEAGLARRALGTLARGAVEGAAYATPHAAATALTDPGQAAEELAYAAAGGGLFAGLGAATARGVELTNNAAKLITETPELLAKPIAKIIGGSIGHAISPGLGTYVGANSADVLEPALAKIISKSAKLTSKQLDKVPELLESLSKKGFSSAKLGGDIFKEFGEDEKDKLQNFNSFSQKLNDNDAILNTINQDSSHLAGNGAAEIADVYAKNQMKTIGYLKDSLPKNPKAPQAFIRDTWTPTPTQINEFSQKLQVVKDPFSVLDELQKGTLTSTHVNTLQTIYPKLYQQIREKMIMEGMDPTKDNLKKMSPAVMKKLSLLLGISSPMESKTMHQAFQANFGKVGKNTNGQANVSEMPSPMTETQKVATETE